MVLEIDQISGIFSEEMNLGYVKFGRDCNRLQKNVHVDYGNGLEEIDFGMVLE